MLIKSHQKGTPYIGNLFKVDRSIFLNDMKQASLLTTSKYSISGHNGHFNLVQVVKSAMGEWIERSSLFYDKYPDQNFISAVNIINGDTIKIEKEKVLFQEKFNDSCGVASHLDSNNAIKAGYYEYFERQCLIHNWITKSQGLKINHKKVNNPNIRHLFDMNYSFIDELFLIDISLHSSLKVIMGLGFGEHYKSIGLSASFDGEDAIIGALEEMFQSYSSKWAKNNINQIDNQVDNNYFNADIYLQNYTDLSPSEFKNHYYYLVESESTIKLSEYIDDKMEFSIENIRNVSNNLNMQPFCAFIPPFHEGLKTKIVRIFSPDGYPHMYPPLFTEAETYLTFNRSVDNFPNEYKKIPFP